jgi:hypothetical protein
MLVLTHELPSLRVAYLFVNIAVFIYSAFMLRCPSPDSSLPNFGRQRAHGDNRARPGWLARI